MQVTTEMLTALLAKVAYNRITLRKLKRQVDRAWDMHRTNYAKRQKLIALRNNYNNLESLYEKQELLVESLVNHPETGEFNENTIAISLNGYFGDNVLP